MYFIIRNNNDLSSVRPGQIGFYVDPVGDCLDHKIISAGQLLEGAGARASIVHTFVVTCEDGAAIHAIGVAGDGVERETYPVDRLGDRYIILVDPPAVHSESGDMGRRMRQLAHRMTLTQRQVQYSRFGCIKAILGCAYLGSEGKRHLAQAFADTILGLPFLDPKGEGLKPLTCSYFVSLCLQVACLEQIIAPEAFQHLVESGGSLEQRRQRIVEAVTPIIEANRDVFGFDASTVSPAALAKFLGVETPAC